MQPCMREWSQLQTARGALSYLNFIRKHEGPVGAIDRGRERINPIFGVFSRRVRRLQQYAVFVRLGAVLPCGEHGSPFSEGGSAICLSAASVLGLPHLEGQRLTNMVTRRLNRQAMGLHHRNIWGVDCIRNTK